MQCPGDAADHVLRFASWPRRNKSFPPLPHSPHKRVLEALTQPGNFIIPCLDFIRFRIWRRYCKQEAIPMSTSSAAHRRTAVSRILMAKSAGVLDPQLCFVPASHYTINSPCPNNLAVCGIGVDVGFMFSCPILYDNEHPSPQFLTPDLPRAANLAEKVWLLRLQTADKFLLNTKRRINTMTIGSFSDMI